MDFDGRCLTVESVEDNESVDSPVGASGVDGIKSDESLLLGSVDRPSGNGLLFNGHAVDAENSRNLTPFSPVSSTNSPAGESSTPPTSKGYGLRKWRRIRRDIAKDLCDSFDDSKALKRGLPASQIVNRPSNSIAPEPHLTSENSSGSVNMITDPNAVPSGSNADPGVDSENSDDQCSRSSTAASTPRLRNNHLHSSGHGKDKNKGKSTKNFSAPFQQIPERRDKEHVEASKKARGNSIRLESGNSHSSIDSNSITPNFSFLQEQCSVEKQSKASMNYENGLDDDKGLKSTTDLSSKKECNNYNGKPAEESKPDTQFLNGTAAWYPQEENNGKDILADSLRSLQSLQEALLTEVNKFSEIGTQNISPEIDESYDENEIGRLTEKVKNLELKLSELEKNLNLKNSMIMTLQDSLNSANKNEAEADNLFRQNPTLEMANLQSKTFKTTSLLLIQVLLLASIAFVFIRQIDSHQVRIVPT